MTEGAMTPEIAAQLARRSRIELDDEESLRLADELRLMADFAATLAAADVDGVPEWTPSEPPERPLRSDEVVPSLPREVSLALAPAATDGYFRVPRTVDES